MRKVYILFVILMSVLISCKNGKSGARVLSENDFENLLVDLHMADALSADYSLSSITGNLDSATIYTAVFRKYNTTRKDFENTLKWYSNHPKKFSKVYDEVFGKLNKKTQELNDKQTLFTKKGSREIWKSTPQLIQGDTAIYPAPFLIPTDSIGYYLIELQVRMLAQDSSINPKFVAYFFKKQEDNNKSERLQIADFPIYKSPGIRTLQFAYKLEDPSYKYLKLIVPEVKNTDMKFMKEMQIAELRVLFYKETEKDTAKK
jgi:hypothetical protein